jgi:hypothetical protein
MCPAAHCFAVGNAALDIDRGFVAAAISHPSEKRRITRAGRDRFVAEGWAEKARSYGWSERELFALPERWSRKRACPAVESNTRFVDACSRRRCRYPSQAKETKFLPPSPSALLPRSSPTRAGLFCAVTIAWVDSEGCRRGPLMPYCRSALNSLARTR